jgi:ABC-2 type transport system ATP-binding protein
MTLAGYDPQLIILDEPTSNLDLHSRERVWNVIRKLVNAGDHQLSILVSTQHLEEAESLAHKVCIIKDGKLIANETPENLRKMTGSLYKFTT